MSARQKEILLATAKWLWIVVMAVTAINFLLLKTGPGNTVIGRLISPITGGDIRVTGLSGNLPHHPKATRVEFLDADGPWLVADNVDMDWRLWSVFSSHVDIARLKAERVRYLRPQKPRQPSSGETRIDIAQFGIDRVELAGPAIGRNAVLTAEGSLHYVNLRDVAADITARQLDGDGQYRIKAAIRDGRVLGTAHISETTDGVAAGLLGLTSLGPMVLQADSTEAGPENRVAFTLKAGDLTANGQGAINLTDRMADVAFTASSPAVSLRPDLSWKALNAKGSMRGSFDRPLVEATVRIDQFASAGDSVKAITIDVRSADGIVDGAATIDGVVLGSAPRLLASAPIRMTARADFTQAKRPVIFAIGHPLLQVRGSAALQGGITSETVIELPSLEAFGALTGNALAGRGRFIVKTAPNKALTNVTVDGTIDAQGQTVAARLLGSGARIAGAFETDGASIVSARAELTAAAISGHLSGTSRNNALDYRWDLALSDASRLAPKLIGTMRLQGTYSGAPNAANATASGEAYIGTREYTPQRVALTADMQNLPRFDKGSLRVSGRFDNGLLDVRLDLGRNNAGALTATLQPTTWKGINARGKVALAAANVPLQGDVNLTVARLADIAPLLGVTATGNMDAVISFRTAQNGDRADVKLTGRAISYDNFRAENITATGTVRDPFGTAQLDLALAATGLQVQDYSGKADARVTGPLDKIAVSLSTDLAGKTGDRLALKAQGTADTKSQLIVLQSAEGAWQEKKFALAAPAIVHYADGLVVDRLRLTENDARLELNGRVLPALAATVTLTNVSAETLRLFAPQLALDGDFSGTADLKGNLDNPEARFDITAKDLRPKGITARGFTDTALKASGTLRNSVVSFDGALGGGKSLQLSANGSLALNGLQEVNIKAKGDADLAMLNAIFTASGQSLAGVVTLDGAVTGTLSQPLATGSIKLSNGEYRDYARGVRLQKIEAEAAAQGAVIRVTRMTAQAGNGTITGNGTVDLGTPGIPVNLSFTARNARPLASDLLTATMNGDVKLSGNLNQRLTLSGNIAILQGEIKIPDKLPPQVAVLDVRRKGQAPPAPRAAQGTLALDLTVTAEGRTFVRGRGIDVDLDGSLRIAGTANQPTVLGGLEMRRGTLSIAGRTLSFTSGKVSFDGTGLRNRIDPTLDLAAETNSNGITAKLAITGYASAPRVILSSTPTLPQDEVIARLLFQQSVKQLTALQLAEIAQALAALGGVGSGFNPIGTLRESLGLDRLSIGSTPSSAGEQSSPTIDAGKYITRNVYVGATQDLSGRTKAIVEVDIVKNLKAQATVTAGTGAAATGAQATQGGDSVGLSYQFDY